jgi:hypothetical protein
MSPTRTRLTYANVAATLALVLALAGGTAIAAKRANTQNIKPRAIKTKLLAPKAVKAGKIAPRAVKRRHIAPASVNAARIAPEAVDGAKVREGSLTPADILGEARTVVTATGGGVDVPLGAEPRPIPLTGGTWTQGAGEGSLFFARVDATLQSEGIVSCGVRVAYRVDGNVVGESFVGTTKKPEPVPVVGEALLRGAQVPSGGARPHVLTAETYESSLSDCVAPRIDAVRVVVVGVG